MNNKPGLYISGETQDLIDSDSLQKAFIVFYETLGLSSNISVSLVFCPSKEMQKINYKYRGVDSTTDVISFPADLNPGMYPSDEKGEIYLGEILIDINHILNQTTTNEIYKDIVSVFIHGLLHLTGYDHLNTKQKTIMHKMEQNIIDIIRQDGQSER